MARPRGIPDDVKAFIVSELAQFTPAPRIVEMVAETFTDPTTGGPLEVTRQAVLRYDPNSTGGAGKRWVAEFERRRAAFLKSVDGIPIAHRAVRLKRLDRMYDAAEQRRNVPLAAALLEQAAKEVGDAYSNRRVLTPDDPAAALARDLGMTKEELLELVSDTGSAGGVGGGGDGEG